LTILATGLEGKEKDGKRRGREGKGRGGERKGRRKGRERESGGERDLAPPQKKNPGAVTGC